MELKQLYQYLGSYISNGYGHLNVAVENAFGEGGDLNSISISNDGKTIYLKESHSPQFFEGGLYDVDDGSPFIAKQATGREGPGIHVGDHILERDEGNNMKHTIAGIPANARFSGIVALFSILAKGEK
jgi:hypothetical protein